jgi:uncharacterized protein YjbI with pentapeptide repeats
MAPLPSPEWVYRGTYRFSFNLTGMGPVWLSADPAGVTGDVNQFTTFAVYDSTRNPGYSALQLVGDGVSDKFGGGRKWWYVDVPPNIGQELYPTQRITGSSQPIGIVQLKPTAGGVDIWHPYAQAWLSCNAMTGAKLWMLPRNTFWTSHAWTMTALNDWSADQTGADLRWLLFDQALVVGKGLKNARFTGANCGSSAFLGCSLQGADFTQAILQQASFSTVGFDGLPPQASDLSGAVFAQTGALGTSFRGCNLTGAKFTNATLSLPMPGFPLKALFAGATLSGAAFSAGAILTAIDFSNAVMRGASMPGANLQQAKFVGADLTGADLSNADLTGADFSSATLTRAKLAGARFNAATTFAGASMMGADFTGCDLRQARFSSPPGFYAGPLSPPTPDNPRTRLCRALLPLSLIGMDWTWLDLTGAAIDGTPPMDLTGFQAAYAIFPNAYDLSKRRLNGAVFTYAQLPNVVLDGVSAPSSQPPDFSIADLTGARMSRSSLRNANFRQATLQKANLTNSVLDFANFEAAHLETIDQKPVDLSYCSLMNAILSGAFLGDADSRGANLTFVTFWGSGAKIDGATISGAAFDNAFLAGVSFKAIKDNQFTGATFSNACLVNCNFQGARLKSVSFTGACLQGADFTAADLDGAQMNGAAIAKEAGKLVITGNAALPSPYSYPQPTRLAGATTSIDTHCPSGDNGPCTDRQWTSPSAPMKTWNAPPRPTPVTNVE